MVSVLLCIYDEKKEYVINAIESILNQTIRTIELIIVLDKPERTDLRELVYKYQLNDSRIVVICNEYNLGLVKSLNRALKVAKGEYVARMDADDISLPKRIEQELYTIEKEGIDLVGTRCIYIDQFGLSKSRNESMYLTEKQVKEYLAFANCIPHPTWLAKKSVYEKLNGYREIPVAEDYDFLLRAIKCGIRVALINEAGLCYRTNPDGISQNNKFKQFLVTDYLSKQYRHKKNVTEESVGKMLQLEYSSKSLKDFERAEELLNMARQRKDEKQYFRFVILLIQSISTSKHRLKLMFINRRLNKIIKNNC